MSNQLNWIPEIKQKFDLAISKMPAFHRPIAEKMISTKAQDIAKNRGANQIEEEDLAKAFFADCPTPFKDLMKKVLDESGIEYKKYNLD
jgi:hypothetical protein